MPTKYWRKRMTIGASKLSLRILGAPLGWGMKSPVIKCPAKKLSAAGPGQFSFAAFDYDGAETVYVILADERMRLAGAAGM